MFFWHTYAKKRNKMIFFLNFIEKNAILFASLKKSMYLCMQFFVLDCIIIQNAGCI